MTDLTGLTIDKALQLMRQEGIQGQVVYTSAPESNKKKEEPVKRARESRVVMQKGSILIAAWFKTSLAEETVCTDE